MKCPICLSMNLEQLLELECGNLDGSFLYNPVRVVLCGGCGHVYNLLTEEGGRNLRNYYDDEYSLSNLSSPNKQGDLPGSCNENSMVRYGFLYDLIRNELKPAHKILDIGCATGGFLRYLYNKGYSRLHGIDISGPYIEEARKDKSVVTLRGSAEHIPYQENQFDFLVADQVIEHLVDPNKIFTEASRVLKNNGLFCVSVPNAMHYNDHFFFDYYWFLMREHVQHFDLEHLVMLARNHGFRFIDSTTNVSNMISEKAVLPGLSVLFRRDGDPNSFMITRSHNLRYKMRDYIEHCFAELERRMKVMAGIAFMGMSFYVYGISREFLYLYENTKLCECNIIGLIDDTDYKQKYFTVDGRKIEGGHTLAGSRENVLITATAHADAIKRRLKDIGFEGKTIEI